MKKILLGALAFVGIASISSCNCGGDKCATTAADSLSTVYGHYVGTVVNEELMMYANLDHDQKVAFLKGFQAVCANSSVDKNVMMGMQVGVQLTNELNQLSEQNINIDKNEVVAAFKAAFMDDSVTTVEVTKATTEFRELMKKVQEQAIAAPATEGVSDNVKLGEEAVAALLASNENAKVSESGLAYIIENEGTAPKAKAEDTVVVNYTGKHLNGDVFDSSEGRGPATFPLQGVVPGFREGLMLLGKGGKATLYLPGELAYGANGQPQAGIGPNEMLVFEVELLDINPQK